MNFSVLFFGLLPIAYLGAATLHKARFHEMDAELFMWWVVPILTVIAGAVYQGRKDAGTEERLRKLEQCEAHRQGSESVEQPDNGFNLVAQVIENTQSIKGIGERVKTLEEV